LLPHVNNGYANAPHCYGIRTLLFLLNFEVSLIPGPLYTRGDSPKYAPNMRISGPQS